MQVHSTASTGHCSRQRLLIPVLPTSTFLSSDFMHNHPSVLGPQSKGEVNFLFNEDVNCKTYRVVVVDE